VERFIGEVSLTALRGSPVHSRTLAVDSSGLAVSDPLDDEMMTLRAGDAALEENETGLA
jgi:hypothetical protein